MAKEVHAVLGAMDPEMRAIKRLLEETGVPVHIAKCGGFPVHADTAYRADWVDPPLPLDCEVWRIECDGHVFTGRDVVVIDHHRPGDPGYGRPPSEFFPASSLGQVIAHLAMLDRLPHQWFMCSTDREAAVGAMRLHHWAPRPRAWGVYEDDIHYDQYRPPSWCVACRDREPGFVRFVVVPRTYVFGAAADHCLAAAYRGDCPGVMPDALMQWRDDMRAAFQRREVWQIRADVATAIEALRDAQMITIGDHRVADMRGRHVSELSEAAAREGICFIADCLPGPDGRTKIVCQSGRPEQIRAFMEQWAPQQGITDIYGDPARGFAGGYLSK